MYNFESMLSNPLFILLMVWSLIWKGMALWRSARLKQKIWFIILLVLNTFGILDIIYLLITQKQIDKSKYSSSTPENQLTKD